MATVSIDTKTWDAGAWTVWAIVQMPHGTASGSHYIEGPEDMTDEALQTAIAAQYGL